MSAAPRLKRQGILLHFLKKSLQIPFLPFIMPLATAKATQKPVSKGGQNHDQ
jgi:hypothetical protein